MGQFLVKAFSCAVYGQKAQHAVIQSDLLLCVSWDPAGHKCFYIVGEKGAG